MLRHDGIAPSPFPQTTCESLPFEPLSEPSCDQRFPQGDRFQKTCQLHPINCFSEMGWSYFFPLRVGEKDEGEGADCEREGECDRMRPRSDFPE